MATKVCRVAFRRDGSAEALSSTAALPLVERLVGAAGVRAGDVWREASGTWAARTRPWVPGGSVLLEGNSTREAACAAEAAHLARAFKIKEG